MTPTTDQLKDLLAKVTQGTWEIDDDGWIVGNEPVCMIERGGITGAFKEAEHDATLIALAPKLAAEVVRLREALADMLFEYGGRYDKDCLVKDNHVLAMIDRARQALDDTSDA